VDLRLTLRRVILLGTPLALTVWMLFHPSPYDDYLGELVPLADWWIALHTVQFMFNIGVYAWIVALAATAVALYHAGAPPLPLVLLVLPAIFLNFDHAFPFGSLTFGSFFVVAAWLELAPGRISSVRQLRR
jgi:hypothetical protein